MHPPGRGAPALSLPESRAPGETVPVPAPTTSPYDPKPGRRDSLVFIVVVTQVVVAFLTASVVYVAWRHLDGNLSAGSRIDHQHAKTIPEQDRDADQEPLNI